MNPTVPVKTVSAKPRIVFLLQEFLAGGIQKHTFDLALRLSNTFDCRLLAHGTGKGPGVVPPELEANSRVLGKSNLLKPSTWTDVAEEIAREKPDLLVTMNQIATMLGAGARALGYVSCPQVVIFHSTEIGNLAGWIRTLPFIPTVWGTSSLVYISKNQQRRWSRRWLSSNQDVLIRNGIDMDRFTPINAADRAAARARIGYSDTDFVIGLCAAFRAEKNHEQLIKAFARLRPRCPQAKLLLVGDGPRRAAIESLAQELGVLDAVTFTGVQADVRPFLGAMDVGVLCSRAIETLSLVALESLAMGLPMIMSETGGASEIIDEGVNGFLFPVGDTAALVECLWQCSDVARNRFMRSQARASVQRKFNHSKMVADYSRLFFEPLTLAV